MKAYARVLFGLTLSAAGAATFADERVTAISLTTLGAASSGADRGVAEAILKRVKVYGGAEHPHTAQNPQKVA